MTDMKTQLKNVAFSGSWSEEILVNSRYSDALSVLAGAVQECRDQDVRTAQLHEALEYLEEKINKGPELTRSFLKAVGEPNPDLRETAARSAYRNIERWAGR